MVRGVWREPLQCQGTLHGARSWILSLVRALGSSAAWVAVPLVNSKGTLLTPLLP
jgi:hypothetical protein